MDRTVRRDNLPSSSKLTVSEPALQLDEEYASSKHETLRQLCEEETNILKMLEMIKHAKNKLVLERLTLVNELMVLKPNMNQRDQDTFMSNSHTSNVMPSVYTTAEPRSALQPTIPSQISTHSNNVVPSVYTTAEPHSASQPTIPRKMSTHTSNVVPSVYTTAEPHSASQPTIPRQMSTQASNVVPSVYTTAEPHSVSQPTIPRQISRHTASSRRTPNIIGQPVKFIKHDPDHSRKKSVQQNHTSLLERMVDGDFYADEESCSSSRSSESDDWLDEWMKQS